MKRAKSSTEPEYVGANNLQCVVIIEPCVLIQMAEIKTQKKEKLEVLKAINKKHIEISKAKNKQFQQKMKRYVISTFTPDAPLPTHVYFRLSEQEKKMAQINKLHNEKAQVCYIYEVH